MPDGNPFDQFDAPPTSAASAPISGNDTPELKAYNAAHASNPFDQFDPTPKTNIPAYAEPAVGAREATADILGAPVDALTWAINKATGANITDPYMGSKDIGRTMMSDFGATPTEDIAPPATEGRRLLRAGGS